jgi:prephenate dehydrogenase
MRIERMAAAEHDRAFALVSHLPHVLSFGLVAQLAGEPDAASLLGHGGGGLRDVARIAGSSPEMWRDICLANRDALLPALEGLLAELELLRGMIEASDGPGLAARFETARTARAKWLVKKTASRSEDRGSR